MRGLHWPSSAFGLTLVGLALVTTLGHAGARARDNGTGVRRDLSGATTSDASRTKFHQGLLAKLPLGFEVNEGQAAADVRFLTRGKNSALMLTGRGAVINLNRPKGLMRAGRTNSVKMEFVGASHRPQMTGANRLPGRVNYIHGKDPSKWKLGVPTYSRVRYTGLYPGIDMVYYGTEGRLEYDMVLAPKADPNKIRIRFSGADSVRIGGQGDLIVRAGDSEVRQARPTVYQEQNGRRSLVAASFRVIDGREVAFNLGEYDRERPLTIDPYVAYGTYLGRTAVDDPEPIAVDSTGIYVAGGTSDWYTSANSSTTYSSLQTTTKGNYDIFLTKLSPDGSSLIYSTYIGGNSDDRCIAMAVDSSQNVYLTGYTMSSTTFPGVGAQSGAGAADVYVMKVGSTGNSISYCTLIGGSQNDVAQGIALDSSNNVFITGNTYSTAGVAAPTFLSTVPTTGVAQPNPSADSDAFVVKIGPTGTKLLGTYLGGTFADSGRRVALDSGGNVIVTGQTSTSQTATQKFPITAGAYQNYLAGSSDVFLTKLSPTFQLGTAGTWSTYIGGYNVDDCNGVVVDPSDNIYIAGTTGSNYNGTTNSAFPTTASAFQNFLSSGTNADAFLSEFNSAGSLLYSTFFGGPNAQEVAYGLQVDASSPGHSYVWVTGFTASTAGNTSTPPNPALGFPLKNATQTTFGGGARDAFLAEFDTQASGANSLLFSTYYGGNSLDEAHSIVIQPGACPNVYIYGLTISTNLPVPYGFQTTKWDTLTDGDAFIARFSQLPAPTATPPADFSVNCTGPNTTVSVSGSGTPVAGQTIVAWNFSEGTNVLASGTNPAGPTYSFSTSISLSLGAHTIVLTVEDSCYNRGTATFHVTVNDPNNPTFTFVPSNIGPQGNDSGKCYATINPGTPTATDACGSTMTISGVTSPGNLAVSPNTARQFPIDTTTGISTYTITWTATNVSGHQTTATQQITVFDNQAPGVVHTATNIVVTATTGATTSNVDPRAGAPTFSDNCSVAYLVGFRDNPGLPDTGNAADLSGAYPLGVSTITWIAMDSYLNFTTSPQTVTVHGADSVSSNFGTDDEGWYVNNNATLAYLSSGGSPGGGGAIRGTDSAAENWSFFSPSKFSGNQSAAFGQALTFQLKANTNAANKDVSITGGGLTITHSITPGTLNAWTSYSLTVSNAGGWKLNGTATAASDAQVKQVLGSVQTIKIPATFSPLPGSQTCLDSVVLNRSY